MWVLSTLQTGLRPGITITVNGKEVAAGFYGRLIKATIRDEAGQTSDQLTVELDDAGNAIELPPAKATIEVAGGWKDGEFGKLGTFELQSISLKGDAESGETMTLQASAADLKRKLKDVDREAFENKTVGEIVQAVAARNGMTARVDPELAKVTIPYRARIDTSEIDFLTTLADELGGVVKPMGSQLVVSKRGKAKAVSGQNLPPITIEKSDCSSWEINPEGRAQYGDIRASWIDQQTGKRRTTKAKTGLTGPTFTLRSPYPNEEQAQKAAEAEARRLTRNTGDGHFQLATGLFTAQAEADVIAGASFRTGIAGRWRSDAVEHEFGETGWHTRIEVKAQEDGSSAQKEKE
ncbi:MAG: late control protein [Chelatococcus sp.]|nr:MAG: late control protein [Chelatococcus sp.]